MALTLAVIAANGDKFAVCIMEAIVGGLIDGLSTVSVKSLYSTFEAVTRPIDTKQKKVVFKGNEN